MFENEVFVDKNGELTIYNNTYRIHIFKADTQCPILFNRYKTFYFYFYIDGVKNSENVCNLIKQNCVFNHSYDLKFSLKIFDLYGGWLSANNGIISVENYFEYFYDNRADKSEPDQLQFKARFDSFNLILPEINNTI